MANPDVSYTILSLANIDKSSFKSSKERLEAKYALYATLRRVQEPWDIALDHGWQEPITTATIKTLIDCGLWRKWVESGGRPEKSSDLAALTNMDPALAKRLLRHLASQNLIKEHEDGDTYAMSDFALALADPKFASVYAFFYLVNQQCFANFPKFASETKYQNPIDPYKSNFASWYGEGSNLLSLASASPENVDIFTNTMMIYASAKTPWVDVYPTETIIINAKTDRPLVVDVGGNLGYDLEKFLAKHPNVPEGSLVLQDLEPVVSKANVKPPIIKQPIDFFESEPVAGARIYLLHTVIHDWPDVKAIQILKNIAAAMEKGYSRILLYENVLTTRRPHPHAVLSDLTMMMSASAVERDEGMWCDLAEQAGLRICRVWSVTEAVESVIELELL